MLEYYSKIYFGSCVGLLIGALFTVPVNLMVINVANYEIQQHETAYL